jgi:hypothetical protein
MSGLGGPGRSGGVEISGSVGSVAGDIVGGSKGLDEEKLLDLLAARGVLQSADAAGLQRRTIVMLARRLKPGEALSFEQALIELERAVETAVDVIARGERGSNDDRFVDRVLARVAERVRANDLEGGVRTVDDAIAEEEARGRRSLATLLEEGIKLDTLRRDAPPRREDRRHRAVDGSPGVAAGVPGKMGRILRGRQRQGRQLLAHGRHRAGEADGGHRARRR